MESRPDQRMPYSVEEEEEEMNKKEMRTRTYVGTLLLHFVMHCVLVFPLSLGDLLVHVYRSSR